MYGALVPSTLRGVVGKSAQAPVSSLVPAPRAVHLPSRAAGLARFSLRNVFHDEQPVTSQPRVRHAYC